MPPPSLIEETVMDNLRDQYVAQGYEFYENPPKHVIPSFLGGFQPDAIAVRSGEGVVLEIKPRRASANSLRDVAERFEGQSKWQFRAIYFDDPPETEPGEPAPPVRLEDHEPRIRSLLQTNETDLALLLAWSVFEGVARAKMTATPRGALTPLQIVERLEHSGRIDPDQANQLRQAATIRNSVAHGHLDAKPSAGLVEVLLNTAAKVQSLKRMMN